MSSLDAIPGMVGSIQTFGELIDWHSHIHAIVSDGATRADGTFVPLPKMPTEPFQKIWEHEVFRLLLNEKRITEGERSERAREQDVRARAMSERE